MKTFLLRLETRSGYKVFFVDSWLTDLEVPPVDDSLDLPQYLDGLLAQTNLNFFILEDTRQIILLKNGMVYDRLPDNFFANVNKDTEPKSWCAFRKNPIYHYQYKNIRHWFSEKYITL